MIDFKKTTIKELHKKLVNNEVSSKELLEYSQKVIAEKNDDINAIIEVFSDELKPLDKNSLLSGIPAIIKDNILFKGKRSTAASHVLEGYTATYDSKIVEIFKKLGVTIVGRSNMDEFAMGSSNETSFYGKVKNPLNTEYVPGGSSGGSAASIASGMAVFALGSDTGGSIRQPASYCGIVGMKPTYGSVSRSGLMALSSSLDVIGPITNTVEDAEIVFNALSEYDEMDSTSVPMKKREEFQGKNENKKVIGVPRSFLEMDGIDPEVLKNFNDSLDSMKEAGYTIMDIDLPLIKHSLAVYYIIQPAEASSNLARFDGIRYGLSEEGKDLIGGYKQTKTKGFGDEVKRRIMLGTYVLSSGYHDAYYYKALALRDAITKEVHAVFDKVDIIATPTTPSVAFKFGEKSDPISMYLEDIFTVPYNLTGNPAISIPSGIHSIEKMPMGIHFTAPMFCEKKLFEIGKDFEKTVK